MTKEEIVQGIHQQIFRYAENETMLNRTLSFVTDLADSIDKEPKINNDAIAEIIRENHNLIVPVVCDDMFEYIKLDENAISVRDYICDLYDNPKTNSAIEAIKTNFYYGITLLEKIRTGSDGSMSNSIFKNIKGAVDSNRIRLKTNVSQFLQKGNFPVIVTTFGFPVIEKELGLDIHDDSIWYNPCERNDLPFVRPERTKVYHIFGGESHSCWAYNEQTLLRFVHSLHSGDYGAKNLSNFLRKHGSEDAKRLLVLGSSLPDWLFRFFIYPMYEDGIKDVHGYWLSLDTIEKGLDLFLDRNHYKGQTNLRDGNRVEKIIAEATPDEIDHIKNHNQKRKIFVSYKRENDNPQKALEIQRVVDILNKQGTVWLDIQEVNKGGTAYWAEIKKAVKNCDVFVPIVTERYIDEFLNADDISQMLAEGFADSDNDSANDTNNVAGLKPVLREAFYAIAYKKKCSPVVIYNEKANLNAGSVEAIAKDKSDSHNLPEYIFNEHTLLLHDDKKPDFFELPDID